MISLHRLPIEVFVQIITGALEPFQTRTSSDQTHLGRLVTLCQVCQRWREVINSTPSLWTTIDVLDPVAVTSAAISRSLDHPLNIIGAPSPGYLKSWRDLAVGWKEFEETAITHSNRWRSIQLRVACPEDAQALMNAPAPLLQSLEVGSILQCRVETMSQVIGPRLRHLALRGLAIPWRSCVLSDLRYLSISSLDDFAPSCEEIMRMLRMCRGLVEVELILGQGATVKPESNKEGPLTLTQLRSISFRRLSPFYTSVLLETIRMPSVRYLSLDLDLSAAGHLLRPMIKRVLALSSAAIDAPYEVVIDLRPNRLEWFCRPEDTPYEWRFEFTAWNHPAIEILEAVLLDKNTNRFGPKQIRIDFNSLGTSNFSSLLLKLDGVDCIRTIRAYDCELESLLTYMTGGTTNHKWGLPELEELGIYDCSYEPSRLLEMVLARYGEGDDILNGGGPPPFKHLHIRHGQGDADKGTLRLVENIVGHDCFMLENDVEGDE
ncbi:hypothetical protein FRC05_002922 [Tulasnella sp. 425]|nr:hypothetical protein FRC05_002922 [Tulasnella sp. 425]